MAKFTNLPIELIQRILSQCLPQEILAASNTCHTLQRACSGIFVLRACFLHHAEPPNSINIPYKQTLSKLLTGKIALAFPSHQKQRIIWSRLASAAQQIPLLLAKLEDLLFPYESVPREGTVQHGDSVQLPDEAVEIIGVLNTWVILGYPTVNNLSITAYLAGVATQMLNPAVWAQWDSTMRCTLASQITFCLALGMLNNRVLNNMMLLLQRMTNILVVPAANREQNPDFVFCANTLEGVQSTHLLSLTCLMWILRGETGMSDDFKYPKPQRLPFLDASEKSSHVPLPDGGRLASSPISEIQSAASCGIEGFGLAPSWLGWLRNQVETLVTNMTSGEWVGHSYNTMRGPFEQSTSTHNVHFLCQSDPDQQNRLLLSSEGCVDNQGQFRLDGHIHRETGALMLEKHWNTLTPWTNPLRLRGALTPLGMGGDWEFLESPNFPIGFWWLFKKEWL